ncbi:MAG TPA: NAD(P)H-binding protein [Microthrixaceae bacterium]|nr:NAD(P)H-binding protein [Microthrixaceae bacterium]
MTATDTGSGLVLVAGSTGYIGRRLVAELVGRGQRVRCLARSPHKLDGETWRRQVEVVRGDVLDASTLHACFDGVDVAYYLVHSIGADEEWEERDRRAACNFRDAASTAGVGQIIYLGGLGDEHSAKLSPPT